MREVFQINDGPHKDKYCVVLGEDGEKYKVCMGKDNYDCISKDYVDGEDPLSTSQVLDLLNNPLVQVPAVEVPITGTINNNAICTITEEDIANYLAKEDK